jgi:polysaccharide pyruvyl transferase WcaK-like protein
LVRFVVLGGWFGSGNLGDDAILIGLKRVLTGVLPDSEIVAISSNVGYTRRVCGVDAIQLLSPLSKMRGDGASVGGYYRTFRGADACIVSGGTPIYDYGHISRIIHFCLPKALKKKLFLFGIGVKPVRSRIGGRLIRALIQQADLVSMRDRLSRDELLRLGIDEPVEVTGDSGLFLTPEKPAVGLRKLMECGVDVSKPMAAICPRALSTEHRILYHEPLSEPAISGIRRDIAWVADWLSESGYEVVFIPMHGVPPDDDVHEIHVIMGLMRRGEPKVVGVDMLPGEAMAVLGRMKLVFGMRLHSLILAAAQGVPFVGVDYDPKIRGFMELAGVEGLLCRLTDGSGAYIEVVEGALNGGEALRARLLRSCGDMREAIVLEARRLAAALR